MKPSDIFKVIINKEPWMLLGGSAGPESKNLLLSFWDCYREEHPDHPVFSFNRERLGKTIPFTLHGDGGRTQKRQPLEIVSMQPVLGLETRASCKRKMCHCETSLPFGGDATLDPVAQRVNSKNSSYLTHFLMFAYPSKSYKDFETLLTGILEAAFSDFGVACDEGAIGFDGEKWFPACLGLKLDMEWMTKCGSLNRSYQNVGTVREIPCCHECDAGSPGIPFEDVNPDAKWVETRWATVPWDPQSEPPWKGIPFSAAQPAKFLRRDVFHIFRLGIGRNFIGSCVYLLCYMKCFLSGIIFICFGIFYESNQKILYAHGFKNVHLYSPLRFPIQSHFKLGFPIVIALVAAEVSQSKVRAMHLASC